MDEHAGFMLSVCLRWWTKLAVRTSCRACGAVCLHVESKVVLPALHLMQRSSNLIPKIILIIPDGRGGHVLHGFIKPVSAEISQCTDMECQLTYYRAFHS